MCHYLKLITWHFKIPCPISRGSYQPWQRLGSMFREQYDTRLKLPYCKFAIITFSRSLNNFLLYTHENILWREREVYTIFKISTWAVFRSSIVVVTKSKQALLLWTVKLYITTLIRYLKKPYKMKIIVYSKINKWSLNSTRVKTAKHKILLVWCVCYILLLFNAYFRRIDESG